ncbi:hypothetical protein J7L68_03175 [bacterium]|nr:hypothetical protein [bacterium]
MKRAWIFAFLLIFFSGLSFAQISCGFIVDLSAPSIDLLYPAPDSIVPSTSVNFGLTSSDGGAGIWYDHITSQAMWDASGMGCDLPVATYITWSVNGGAFNDTVFDMISTTHDFGSGDTIQACVHIIDHIEDYGCSCCPNDTDTCWTFYIFACDSFQLTEFCPNPCEIVTSCSTQTFTFLLDSIGSPTGGPDSAAIGVELDVNGTPYTGTIGSATWAEYHGNPDDGIYPDTIVISSPTGFWNHHDSVVVTIGDSICPIVLPNTCSFVVDLVPPELVTYSPADAETLTNAVVNITGSLTDDFIGIASGSTWVSITTYDTLGGINYDTTFSLSDMFNINRTFNSGDSIVVCVHSADDVDLQPGCTCSPNQLDTCWWFTVLTGEPYGWVVIPFDSNSNGTIVSDCFSAGDSTCGNQQIILRVYDSHGMMTSPILLYVNGIPYTDTSPAISTTLLGTDTLEITFDPSAIGTCWVDAEWIHFDLDSAVNALGFNIVSNVIDSFIVDLSPPVFSGLLPVDSSIINNDSVMISVNVTDIICGDAILTNVHANGIMEGIPVSFDFDSDSMGADSFGYNLTGFQNGDSLTICAYAQDTCADYCGPNIDSTCWTFTIVMGTVSASVVAPVDTNGDGWIISNCADQQIIWSMAYDDSIGIDWSRLWVTVDGTPYNWSDSHLDTLNPHTLIFSPLPDWGDHDSIVFCLDSLFDTTGAVLESPACGWVLIDLEPPVLVASTPIDGDTIYVHDISVNATFYDSLCTDTLTSVDSCWANEWSGGAIINTFEGYSFPLDLTGLADGDSIEVCAIVLDGCRDYCDFNMDTLCWYFLIMMGEPWGEFIAPPDTNLDGARITTCADGGFILYLHDSHGMDTTYFHFTVDTNGTGPVDYHYGDPEVSVSYITDSTTMEILFDPSWTLSSGSWVYVALDSAINILAVPDSLVTPVVDSFLIDTEPPTFTYTGPSGTISEIETTIAVGANDDICGSNIVYDSLVITSTVSGIDWHITTGDWDTTIAGMLSGDSVSVCAYAHDICSDTCGPNYGDSCWYFLVETGIAITLLEPIDINSDGDTISACADQKIRWFIDSDIGVDSSSIIVDVCGTVYNWGDAELSAIGDTLVWTPPIGFWTDGTHCDFSLAVCDSGGVCDTSYGQVLIDLAPPIFSGEYPTDGSTILVDNTDIHIIASDAVCVDFVAEFIHITSSVSGLDITVPDTLAAHISGLVDGDSVTVCVAAHDTCADYFCTTANHDTTCWTFHVALGAVRASVLQPKDINGDLCINTACECQPILWQVISQHGIDTAAFEAVIDGITYNWGSEFTLTLTPIVGDTVYTIEFNPMAAGTCWTENGYIVDYAITYLVDTLGTDSLAADVGGSFTELLVPPSISLIPLPEDTAVCLDSVYFTAFITDTVACTYVGTLTVNLTGTSPDSSFDISLSDIATNVSVPVLSGDTLCVHINTFNVVDYSDSCSFTDTLFNWMNSLDTCYRIHCLCDIYVYAGPDQYSCPGADVILGCEPVYSGSGYTTVGVNWYIGDSLVSTDENPIENPDSTITYIAEAWAICVAGDTVWAYDTMTVYIDYEPVVSPVIVSPLDSTELIAGTHTLVWNALDTTIITAPIFYQVLKDTVLFSPDSMTDTTFDFDIACEETLTFAVVAFNSCYYELDDSCNSADSMLGYTSATYETSAVIVVYGEPCGRPQAQAIYPPPNTISGCDSQLVIFEVWDGAGVGLVPESLRVQMGSNIYDTSAAFIKYTYVSDDSGIVTVAAPTGLWNDNDTITIRIIELYNVFEQPLPGPVSLTFYTDFTPPAADMSYPIPDTVIGEHSPTVVLNITDNVCGVVEDSFIVWVHNSRISDSLTYPSSSELNWDPSNDNLSISFEDLGIILADGETISIDLHTCDCVDSEFCGPNCAPYSWSFWYPYEVGCSRVPNPFTPNDDSENEYAQFTFPDMAAKDGTIYIYDMYSSLVKQIDVAAGQGVTETRHIARWYGKDSKGNKVPQGVYLYVIVVDGEVVCEGTVTVAR